MILAPRYLPRLASTVGLFTRYGLADFAKQQGLHTLGPEPEPTDADGGSAEQALAFRKRLVELGPAYIKLGQVLSMRPDLLPPVYIEQLAKLQDDVDPIPPAEIIAIIEEALGARISKLFGEFTDEPVGTASLGQVHAAELRDGRPVVVKVQRPNLRELLTDDIQFFRELATFMVEHTAAGSRIDMIGVVQQLEQALADELDYRIEARNAASFRRTLAEFPRLLVPRVIETYTTERVLTMERIRGTKIDKVSPLARLEHDFHPVADELMRAYLKQISIDGHFHADPHPGNVFIVLPESINPPTPSEVKANDRRGETRVAVTPLSKVEAEAQAQAAPQPFEIDVKLALIDFGMTARLSTTLKEKVVRLLLDLADNRGDDAAETMIEVGTALPDFDRDAYIRDIAALMARNYNLTIGEIDAGAILYELINISYQRGLRLPAELTLLAKALFNLTAVTKSLDWSYDPIPTIRAYANQIVADRAKREFNPRRLYRLVTEGSELLAALPHRLDLISARMASNEFATKVEVPQFALLIEALQKVANRVFSGLVLAGLLVASAMLLPYHPSLGTSGFVLAGVIGLWMILAILWSDRQRQRKT
jgi:ubiquinone biosynthesis protein